jgi:hypothetical protein
METFMERRTVLVEYSQKLFVSIDIIDFGLQNLIVQGGDCTQTLVRHFSVFSSGGNFRPRKEVFALLYAFSSVVAKSGLFELLCQMISLR